MKNTILICFVIFFCLAVQIRAQIPVKTLVQISRAEDELRFDKTLEDLMKSTDAHIRTRAALASGRIGKEAAVAALSVLLEKDSDITVRQTAAFALGEIESTKGADALLKILANLKEDQTVRVRAVEAAGKIAAANAKDEKAKPLGKAILDALQRENVTSVSTAERNFVLLGVTAILRARPDGGEAIAAKFLDSNVARIRADAANTLSRLRSKIANEKLRSLLASDKDAVVRANVARALGAAEDASAFDILLGAAVNDSDLRVRVSAIRSLGSLKDARAADKLLTHGEKLLAVYKNRRSANPTEKNEFLEIATTLGRLLANTNDERAGNLLKDFRRADRAESPEIEIAYARISPAFYSSAVVYNTFQLKLLLESASVFSWKALSSVAEGLGEIAALETSDETKSTARESLRAMLEKIEDVRFENIKKTAVSRLRKEVILSTQAIPSILRASAAFKPNDLPQILRAHLKHDDAILRATAAELLAEQTASKETVEALKTAFTKSILTDKKLNDAQLAILDALFKLDKKESVGTLLIALNASDYLVRKKAFELLKDKDLEKDSPGISTLVENALAKNKDRVLPPTTNGSRLGVILNANTDYVRAISRKKASAILTTEKGIFTIEFFPEAAPLTVDNFIKLARAKYFDGLEIHRVVPNFVMQDGDPRGDGNGGPGWEIRDEINTIPFERGTVGMALSGKDTGGSQWFVCHSPQPHLDGGYTVFGRVNEAEMKVVDNLTRGDKILSVRIVEGN